LQAILAKLLVEGHQENLAICKDVAQKMVAVIAILDMLA
jgi:hypothetical protein